MASQSDLVSSSQLPQSELAPEILEALNFERSMWVTGSVHTDPFYTLVLKSPSDSSLPGTLLKVQETVDPTLYSLPSSVSISRIISQSLTLTGDPVPVSVYILWALLPRRNSDGSSQIVAWAHGTSGISSECAPSHLRNLYQHFFAFYLLVLSGYVVVATDFAGLEPTDHSPPGHYLANPAAANDVIYSILAAHSAFPSLGSKFVSISHSQGGGAVWAIAQHHAKENIEGYLGGVAISPTTDIRSNFDPIGAVVWAVMMLGLKNVFPQFQYSDVFTEEGFAALNAYKDIERGGAVGRFIHEEKDQLIDFTLTEKAVYYIAMKYHDSELEFIRLSTTHDSAMTGSQWIWMDWIRARFEGKVTDKCGEMPSEKWEISWERSVVLERLKESYGIETNWLMARATEFYPKF
ncbi:uncharacterized protein EAF01_008184 [Botrytis porri]|uniref:uncharacterized protein n=1 Tax=Botrytis porri TaxID=87229 RepID=UPI0019023C21|nr:uncharacterized protein EAF01_008184 [Botrytis porri]KAF7898971.1 hypothetical protein EAF01_008184 [Botrytis porri]